MDIRYTKDKKVVICHDKDLKRLCGLDKLVRDVEYAQLPQIKDTIDLHFSTNQYKATSDDDRKIPLLEDVMKACPDVPFNMELKDSDDELKTDVLKLIRKYNRESITIWGNVKEAECMKMKRMAPDIPTFTPFVTIAKLSLLFLVGYLPFYRLHHDTFQFPYLNEDYVAYKMKYEGDSNGQRAYLFSLKVFNFFSKLIFYHLRQRRIFVFLYTINNTEQFDEAISRGIDGIITDSPTMLVNHISKKQK